MAVPKTEKVVKLRGKLLIKTEYIRNKMTILLYIAIVSLLTNPKALEAKTTSGYNSAKIEDFQGTC